MNADRLLALYDRVADAPDAVDRLRRFVLDLAVRGKLVEQDPVDEPAVELLKRIAAEKVRMVKEGEIRKPRNLSNGDDLVTPFEIPTSWCWDRLDAIGAIVGGGTPPAGDPRNFSEPGRGFAWLTPKDLGGYRSRHIERGSRDLSPRGLQSSSATLMPAGTVLFSSRAPIGYVAIAANAISTNQGFKSIVPYVSGCSEYIALAMQAFAPRIEDSASGTTFKEVSGRIVAGVPFPLPPLAEQRRIVAKVNQLMALCDRLEETRNAQKETRDQLTEASLTRLTVTNTDASSFQAHARLAINALPALTARADQVKHLRQTILGLAVRGKLVDQDSSDEPASELLKQIAEVRVQLGIKHKVEPPDGKETLFRLPVGWHWSRIGELCTKTGSGSTPRGGKSVYKKTGVPFLRSQNVYDDGLRLASVAYIGGDIHARMAGTAVRSRDLLLNITGGSMGRCCRVPDVFAEANVSQHVAIIRPAVSEMADYLHKLVLSPHFQAFIFRKQTGAGRGGLPKNRMDRIVVAVPPLAEQCRIVAKVDELMMLCDRMETGLDIADATRSRLLESLLHDALSSYEAAISGRR